jgi:OOP family OmpA-OmpF porin
MTKQLLAAAAAALLCTAASAQTYGVISAGSSHLNADCTGAASCDRNDTAFKLLLGYKFTPNLALEGGYLSFGKATASDSTTSVKITTDGLAIGGAYHADLAPDWNLVVRLGLVSMKTKVDATVVEGGSGTDSDRNVVLYTGLGVGYKINKQLSADLSLDLSKSKYNKNGLDTSGNVRALSVGLTYAF